MKKIGDYTVRGQVNTSDGDVERIILFDRRFDTGYKITHFEIAFQNRNDTAIEIASAKLTTTDEGIDNRDWNWGINTEIAWASCAHDANVLSTQSPVSVVDRDNLIVEDLFIGAYSYTDTEVINYLIHMEKYDISDFRGALAMVRNRSQA